MTCLSLILLLVPYLMCKAGEVQHNLKHGEAFPNDVNGLSFGKLSVHKQHTTEGEVVIHMEIDLKDADSIIYMAGLNLYKLKWDSDEDPAITKLTEEGSFNQSWYPSFTQLDKDNILIVDGSHHCLVQFNRDSRENPKPIVGVCGKKGYRDGPIDKAQFDFPYKIIKHPSANTFYLTENYHIRRIEFVVTTVLLHSDHEVLGLAMDFEGNCGYYTTAKRLHKFTFPSPEHNIKHLSEGERVGHADGPLINALFNWPTHITLLNRKTLMIADIKNQCYRIVDLANKFVMSLTHNPNQNVGINRDVNKNIIYDPATQLYLPNRSVILVTDGRGILRLEVTDLMKQPYSYLSMDILTWFVGAVGVVVFLVFHKWLSRSLTDPFRREQTRIVRRTPVQPADDD